MRTIDFRGKAVGSGRWIHGDLVWNGRTPAIFEDANQENGCITVKESTLGMNTGLKDKHGHEIYNGDILAHGANIIGHVVDGVRGYCFDVVYITQEGEKSCPLFEVVTNFNDKLEIVGNIHDKGNGGADDKTLEEVAAKMEDLKKKGFAIVPSKIYNTGDEGQQFEMMVPLLALDISL